MMNRISVFFEDTRNNIWNMKNVCTCNEIYIYSSETSLLFNESRVA